MMAVLSTAHWQSVAADLFDRGVGRLGRLLVPSDCHALTALFDDDSRFRSTVVMEQVGYGRGRYRYFDYPLPPTIATLRQSLYAGLAPIANAMQTAAGRPQRFPDDLDTWLAVCHAAGQTRPTPLLLRYHTGGYNALHRDLYGDLWFPLQVVVQLSDPSCDFSGGEFLLVEQRPRQQSVGRALQPGQGEGLVFPVFDRPVPRRGGTGHTRRPVRHGVSEVSAGVRTTLGLIFHDAA